MPLFMLLDRDGHSLGPLDTTADVWETGDRIAHGPTKTLQVLEVLPRLIEHFDGYLVVEPVE